MVTGWEKFTHELTEFEKAKVFPGLVRRWQRKDYNEFVNMKSMIQAINQNAVEKQLKTPSGKQYKTNGPRIRKMIHAIRVSGLVPNLIANSKGYFKSDDPQKVRNFIKSCRERSNSFLEVANAMETYNFER